MTIWTLNALRDEAHRIAKAHGFKDATVGEDIALMHSELSEALEEYRRGAIPHEVYYEETVPAFDIHGNRITDHDGKPVNAVVRHATQNAGGSFKPCGLGIEIIDVGIRAFHFCGKHGIDMEKGTAIKMAYNDSRPYKHGGKVI